MTDKANNSISWTSKENQLKLIRALFRDGYISKEIFNKMIQHAKS